MSSSVYSLCFSLLAVLACREDPVARGQQSASSAPPIRVIEPPADLVRPVPPFSIEKSAVGPIELGSPFSTVFAEMSLRAHLELIRIERVADKVVSRAESGKILFGGDNAAKIDYVAVLDGEVAEWAGGVHVGIHVDKLDQILGKTISGHHVSDARLRRYQKAPSVAFIVERERVRAIIVNAHPVFSCTDESCEPTESVSQDANTVIVGDDDKQQRLRIPGLIAAGVLDIDGSGKPAPVALASRNTPGGRVYFLHQLAQQQKRMVVKETRRIYRVTDHDLQWGGVRSGKATLLLEVYQKGNEPPQVGGYLWVKSDSLVVPLSPVSGANFR